MTVTDPTGHNAHSLPLRRIAGYAAGSALVAAVVVVCVVLPSEYGMDPTGFGDLTGLTALSEPPEVVVETALAAPAEVATMPETPFREDEVTITVGGMTQNWGQVEYKLSLLEGDDVVYHWSASAPIYYEFHGHTIGTDSAPMRVMDYIKGEAASAQGRLTAPVEGVHGWFFRNEGFDPIEITFRFAGFYRLEPGIVPFERQ